MADAPPEVGARAQHRDGSIVTWDGQNWNLTTPAPPRGGAHPGAIPPRDAQTLETMRSNADDAASVEQTLNQVRDANHRLQPGPWRGEFLNTAIPHEGQGILGSIGSVVLGGPARLTGAVTPQNVDDYQAIQRARNQAILREQSRQHGVQTEGDAARMALVGVNMYNTPESNDAAINQGVQQAIRGQARATFYSTWASRYGSLSAPNEQGANVDAVWAANQPHIINQYLQMRDQSRRGQGQGQATPPSIVRIR